MVVFARIWARFAVRNIGCPLSPPCQQKNLPRAADYGDFFLELLQYSCYTGAMPRRFREYLDRLSHRDTHREEPNTYTVNTTVNMNDLEWHPVRWNATQWFPSDDVPPTRVYHHDMDNPTAEVFPGRTVRASEAFRMLENAYNNMTARDVMEMAEATPENMLRLVRLSMPNLAANELVEERPMDSPSDDWISRATGIPASYFSADYNEPITYTPSWSNRTISWSWGDRLGGHVEFRRGKIIRVKRYCKI